LLLPFLILQVACTPDSLCAVSEIVYAVLYSKEIGSTLRAHFCHWP